MNTIIRNADLFTPFENIKNGTVLVTGKSIRKIGTTSEIQIAATDQVIDAGGARVIPGLIDTHIHGAGGFDVSTGGTAGVAEYLARHSITGFLATTHFVMPHEELIQSVSGIAAAILHPPCGAKILGIHMEGPWIAADRSPFSREDLCYPITIDDVRLFMEISRDQLRMITFAPELMRDPGVIPWLREHNIIPSVGHTNADYQTVMQAVAIGLNHSTHTYNAMPLLHHRSPGTIGAVMDTREIYAEMIADGFHVLPPMMRLLIKAKGADRVSLVSDAVPLAGLPPGTHMNWCGLEIGTDGEISILNDGRPAGAYKLINQGIKVLVETGVADFAEAVAMASSVPAEVLNLKKGRLETGYDADLVILDDQMNALLTMIEGQIVYSKLELDHAFL